MDNNRMTMDNELRIVQGNTFATAIEIHAVDATGQPIVDWSLEDSTDLRVWYVFAGREQDITTWQIEDGKLVVLWLANMQRVGTYDIFCAGKYNGADWRNAMQYQFRIVRFNHEANIPSNVIILDGIYQLSAEMAIITRLFDNRGTPSNTTPNMDGEAEVGTEERYARGDHRHPSDTSKQDVIADLAAIRSGAEAGATAYQKPSTGIPKTDLSSAVQTSLGKADTALQAETEPLFTASPAHGITSEDISNWDAKSDFSGNYNDLTNKPTIPTALSQLSQDTTHRVVTDTEKTTWNNKSDFSGSYNDLTNKPTIPAAQVNSDWDASSGVAQILNKPAIPTALSQLTEDTTHRVVTDTEKAAWNGKANKVLVNNHGTSDTTFAVTPNILHIWGTVASLTLTLATPTDATIVNEYMIEFVSGSTATTLSLPASVEWGNRDPLTGQTEPLVVQADATYQISIINNIGLWTAIANS